jgi:hypothetical protein
MYTEVGLFMFLLGYCRYRHEFKSQELWEEIKIVLDGFCEPITELLKVVETMTKYILQL